MSELLRTWRRRGLRRPFLARCEAVSLERDHPVGERLLDLSPRGALIATSDEVSVGDAVLLSFRMPWLGPMVHVKAVVERVVAGCRHDDPGSCAGVRFMGLSSRDRLDLSQRLALLPRTGARRRHPTDYARMVRRVQLGLEPSPNAS